jgi:hypothetical protein
MAKADSIPPVLTSKQILLFWSKVAKAGPDDCWLWTACITKQSGYGKFTVRLAESMNKPTSFVSHVIARWLATGEWPVGVCTLHNCPGGDNRQCCNPNHLWLGTNSENSADMVAKGRSQRQTDRGSSP